MTSPRHRSHVTSRSHAVSAKEPAEVEVLVTYNSNSGLARHVARQLETHCRISTKLDVVDIPQNSAGMVSEAAEVTP